LEGIVFFRFRGYTNIKRAILSLFMVQIFGNKNLEDLKQGDVEGLINRGEEESIILEFKKELGSDSKEIAKDLSSMANAEGGLVIYGVEEDDNGKAKSIEWIDSLNFEEKIENIISTTINPIIPFKIIPVSREEENTKKSLHNFIAQEQQFAHGN
jgi:predicted HTH transcriptional regulator